MFTHQIQGAALGTARFHLRQKLRDHGQAAIHCAALAIAWQQARWCCTGIFATGENDSPCARAKNDKISDWIKVNIMYFMNKENYRL